MVDRELFGTLTAVLVPPSISLAVSVLEAVAAAAEGVRCISVSYPQSGHLTQDVAALRAIHELAARYLPAGVQTHAVLHEFMGVFPRERRHAEQLIFFGALTARLGGASKMITKTYQEAFGIPDAEANAAGLRLADIANSSLLGFISVDEEAVAEEQEWICREVAEIVEPVLASRNLHSGIVTAFAEGRLDIPFSASRHAHSAIIPRRDSEGAIRYQSHGNLPLSAQSVARNQRLLAVGRPGRDRLGGPLRRAPARHRLLPPTLRRSRRERTPAVIHTPEGKDAPVAVDRPVIRVGIVGAGPRGVVALERLCVNAPLLAPGVPVEVHLIDPYPAGGGRVWKQQQNRSLLMNTVASDVTVFTDESVPCEGPIVTGPTQYQWARMVTEGHIPDVDEADREEARGMLPWSYGSRALNGAYLGWALGHIIRNAPSEITVRFHRTRAVELEDLEDGTQRLMPASRCSMSATSRARFSDMPGSRCFTFSNHSGGGWIGSCGAL